MIITNKLRQLFRYANWYDIQIEHSYRYAETNKAHSERLKVLLINKDRLKKEINNYFNKLQVI